VRLALDPSPKFQKYVNAPKGALLAEPSKTTDCPFLGDEGDKLNGPGVGGFKELEYMG